MPSVTPYDWEALRLLWCPVDDWEPAGWVGNYYRVKYEVAERLQPKSILEIGVRAGYSAQCFLWACPEARYLGIDADRGKWGGRVGFWLYAWGLLRQYDVEMHIADSQQMRPADLALRRTWDFWHIDGDHTYLGALHDLVMGANAGAKWMLLDDYDYIGDVQRAGDDFAKQYRDTWGVEYVGDGGFRGNLLFTRVEVTP